MPKDLNFDGIHLNPAGCKVWLNYLRTHSLEDEAIAARAAAIQKQIDDDYGAVFAKTEVLLNGDKDPGNRTEETNLGDLITDAILWYATKDGEDMGVAKENVVALTNGGGIRAPIAIGDISKNDVNTVLPFGNTVAYVTVTGAAQLMLAGASAVAVGTALFADPFAPLKVRDGLARLARQQGLEAVRELTGGVKPW